MKLGGLKNKKEEEMNFTKWEENGPGNYDNK